MIPAALPAGGIGDIARRVLGTPNKGLSTLSQLRFGARGSVAVEIAGEKAGTWFDHENQIGGGPRDLVRIKAGIPESEIDPWMQREFGSAVRRSDSRSQRRRIVKTYDYGEGGKLVYQVVRYEPKSFRQRRPGPNGAWVYNLHQVRRLLYRLDELRAAPACALVHIVEGEKDVDSLIAAGCVATCNSEGTGKWRPHFARELQDRDVVIIPDGDDAGRKHALAVVASVAPVARSVRMLELPDIGPKGDVSDWLAAGGSRERLGALAAEAPVWCATPEPGSNGLQLVGFDDMKPRLGEHYLIKGLLASSSMAVVYGDSGTGKTYLALHFALCVAAGAECFGRRVRRAGVVYVAAEAGASIQNRVAAAKCEIEFPETMPFAAIMVPLDLRTNLADVERLVTAIREADLVDPVELIIVDTLSRTIGSGNENAPEDMGAFVRSIDELRAQLGAAVLIVHHSGKDASRGARGHSLLRAATDTEIEVSRDPGSRVATARVTKQRDGISDGQLQFALRVVELGIDSDGEIVTSCVVDEVAEARPSTRPLRLSPQQQTALNLLKRAIEEGGEEPPASNHIPASRRAVTEEIWRRHCYLGGISASGDQRARRQAFGRAAEALTARGIVGRWEQWAWLV